MTNILLGIVIVLLVLVSVLDMVQYVRFVKREQARAAEERVQAAMDAAAAEEARKSHSIDQGFENIMAYEVKLGRGVTSGG